MLKPGNEGRNTIGQVRGELAYVTNDGRQAKGKQQSKQEKDRAEQECNGQSTRDATAAAGLEKHDAVDDGQEHCGEESADIDDREHVAKAPRQQERNQHPKREEDMASDGGVGFLGLTGDLGLQGLSLLIC